MTRLYTMDNKLIIDEPDLGLKEAIEKHKDDLRGADLTGANLERADLTNAILDDAILD